MKKICIIGGGAAGMLAAIKACGDGNSVHLYEKNDRLGKKLFITGKGRCNLTNNCDVETLLQNVVTNRKFLYSAFYTFNSQDMMQFMEYAGLPLKTERGNRVFPVSDKSSDVLRVLTSELKRAGVNIHLNTEVKALWIEEQICRGLILAEGEAVMADAVIVAAGGISYPGTGSTGDGYRFAKAAGHTVTDTMPSLVPLRVQEGWCPKLMGLSLKNVRAVFSQGKKKLYEEQGEMLFTHFGVSGPLILSGSAHIVSKLKDGAVALTVDLKPALTEDALDARICRDFEKYKNRQLRNALSDLLPTKFIPVILELSGIDPYKQVNAINRQERQVLLGLMKHLTMTVVGTRDYNEAVITRGGVAVREVDPSTMESKLAAHLYFCGEVLDVDALTGGYNLQIAWSSAWLAGMSAAGLSE